MSDNAQNPSKRLNTLDVHKVEQERRCESVGGEGISENKGNDTTRVGWEPMHVVIGGWDPGTDRESGARISRSSPHASPARAITVMHRASIAGSPRIRSS